MSQILHGASLNSKEVLNEVFSALTRDQVIQAADIEEGTEYNGNKICHLKITTYDDVMPWELERDISTQLSSQKTRNWPADKKCDLPFSIYSKDNAKSFYAAVHYKPDVYSITTETEKKSELLAHQVLQELLNDDIILDYEYNPKGYDSIVRGWNFKVVTDKQMSYTTIESIISSKLEALKQPQIQALSKETSEMGIVVGTFESLI